MGLLRSAKNVSKSASFSFFISIRRVLASGPGLCGVVTMVRSGRRVTCGVACVVCPRASRVALGDDARAPGRTARRGVRQ